MQLEEQQARARPYTCNTGTGIRLEQSRAGRISGRRGSLKGGPTQACRTVPCSPDRHQSQHGPGGVDHVRAVAGQLRIDLQGRGCTAGAGTVVEHYSKAPNTCRRVAPLAISPPTLSWQDRQSFPHPLPSSVCQTSANPPAPTKSSPTLSWQDR